MPPETQGEVVIDGHRCESSWIANKVTCGRYGADFNVIQDAVNYCDAIGGEWVIELYPRGEAGAAVWDESGITPNGAAIITIKGMGEGRVVIAPAAAVAAVIVSGFNLILEDITVTAPGAGQPALRIEGGTCEACDCELNGAGVGDAIQMVAGTLNINDSDVPAGDVDLSTANCILTCVDTNFNGTIDTAGAFVHTITMFNCDLGGQTLNLAATGICAYAFHNCMNMSTITDASLAGQGHLCQCDVLGAGLVVSGTSAWIVDNSGVVAVSNTDATTTATIAIYAGIVLTVTRAIGSVVWWQDANTLKVIPSGTVTDPVIGWAVAAAGAGDTIVLHPGTYRESVVLVAGVNLVGLDREACLLDVTDGNTGITMAEGCRVANFSILVTATGGNSYGFECNNVGAAATPLYLEDINIALVRSGGNAYGIAETTGNAARVIHLRNVRVLSDTDTNEYAIFCDQANKTFYIEESWIQGGDYALFCDADSIFYVSHSQLDVNVIPPGGGDTIYCAAATMYFRSCTIEKQITVGNLGIVRLKNSSHREINRTGTGAIVDESSVLMEAPWHVERWNWQAALANSQVAVRGTPIDAGSGQVLLEVTDNGAGQEAVEVDPPVAGALTNVVYSQRTPRFLTQISVDSFDTHVTMFFGLRGTLGNAVPGAAEDHCGFDWNGANFRAISSDGAGVGEQTNLTAPSTDVQHQLEVICFASQFILFYVDGVLVATHSTEAGRPTPGQALRWQHLLATAGGGGGDVIQVTVRNGGVQECPA